MTDRSDNRTTEETETEPGNNRRDLFRKIVIVGAGAAVGSAVLSNRADAADNDPLQIGSSVAAVANNTGTTPTVFDLYPTIDADVSGNGGQSVVRGGKRAWPDRDGYCGRESLSGGPRWLRRQ